MNSDDVGVFDVGNGDDRQFVVDDNDISLACMRLITTSEVLACLAVVSEQVKRRRLRLWLSVESLVLLPILVWLAWWMRENF